IAVGSDHKPPARPHGKALFLHQTHHPFVVDDEAVVPHFGGDPAIAVDGPFGGDLPDPLDQPGLFDRLRRGLVVEGRARKAHQSASLADGEPGGRAITNVASLLGDRAACREAPFRKSFSSVSRPPSRSRAAMRASYSARMPAAASSLSSAPASY